MILIGVYIWTDPFKVIYNYDIYLSDYVMLRRGFVSTEVFLKNNKSHHFDSFIFGSSRSLAFSCKEWKKYLPEDCSAFSYGNWNESIEGIFRKIRLIDSMGDTIKNVIIVIDTDKTFLKGNKSEEDDHYVISGKSVGQFHMMYFSNFLRNYWLIPACIDYKLFKTRRSYFKEFIGMKPGDINPINNDWFPDSEEEILRDSISYYSRSLNKFYERPVTEIESGIQITSNDSIMMQKANSIFKKDNTSVLIIVGPLYDQIKLNVKDLQMLQTIFGKGNVYDFSGINDLTNNEYNYTFEVNHYRNRTGSRILKRIYNLPQSTIK
jgi:hypothetical protein